jgi:outer membrane lipoprotein-sorting protein
MRGLRLSMNSEIMARNYHLLRRWMLMLLAATTLGGLPSACLVARAAAQSAAWTLPQILKQVDRGAKEFKSLTADVERTKVTVVVDDHSTESGQIRVRKDAKMRIDLTSPDPRTILRTGDKLYIYNPKIHRVEEYDLGQHREMLDQFILLGFGTNADDLRKSFTMSVEGEETLGTQKTVRLQLMPKDGDVLKEISRIDLWLDEATWVPAQQKFYESGSGDYFTVRYSNVTRNVPIPDARFRQNWPVGTTRVKPQG